MFIANLEEHGVHFIDGGDDARLPDLSLCSRADAMASATISATPARCEAECLASPIEMVGTGDRCGSDQPAVSERVQRSQRPITDEDADHHT